MNEPLARSLPPTPPEVLHSHPMPGAPPPTEQPLPQNLPAAASDNATGPAPADAPEPEPWNLEAPVFDPSLPDDAEVRPIEEASLLEDPRFQRLIQLFDGRLRKFYPEAPREAALEAPSGEAECESD